MKTDAQTPEPSPSSNEAPSQGQPSINNCWKTIGLWGDSSCPELQKFSHCRNCPVYSAAGIRMLDRELAPGYLAEWTELLARPKLPRVTGTKSVVVFRIGTDWLSLPAPAFQEVAEDRGRHTLPHRDNKILLGLVNIRGELLICASLGGLLGLEMLAGKKAETRQSVYERLLVVRGAESRFAFPVSEVYGIHRYHPTELKEIPTTVSQATAKYSHGVLLWRNQTVGCLDDQLVFYTLNRSLT